MGPTWSAHGRGLVYRQGHAVGTESEPIVAQVFAMPELSLALTVICWSPRTQRPATSPPSAATSGAVGSSIVTADAVV